MDEIEKDTAVKSEKKATKLDKKINAQNSRGRGVWRKIKRPVDGFETAETVNIGKHLYNSVGDSDKKEGEKPNLRKEEEIETTAKTIVESEITTTARTLSTDVLTTTVIPEQNNNDDSHTGMFDDVRKAFTEYLSLEDDSDDAVNMEEADDRLFEALRDSTTTQIPTTDEPIATTTLPPTTSAEPTFDVETSKPVVKKEKKQVKTSTSQKVTGEICFRGRCIKTEE